MARIPIERGPKHVTETRGKLSKTGDIWKVGEVTFTVDKVKNPWVVRNLKKFILEGRSVTVRVGDGKLLMVRVV